MAARPFKVICISMYEDDLAELDACIVELKDRGLSRATRSGLIRHALRQLRTAEVKREDFS